MKSFYLTIDRTIGIRLTNATKEAFHLLNAISLNDFLRINKQMEEESKKRKGYCNYN